MKPNPYEIEKSIREKNARLERISKIVKQQATITGFQKYAMEGLKRSGIQFVSEKRILKSSSFYLVDIYLPEYGICIEIDGNSHDSPDKIEKDRKRDSWLLNNGYWVFRIRNEEVKQHFLRRIFSVLKIRKHIIDKNGNYKRTKRTSFQVPGLIYNNPNSYE